MKESSILSGVKKEKKKKEKANELWDNGHGETVSEVRGNPE